MTALTAQRKGPSVVCVVPEVCVEGVLASERTSETQKETLNSSSRKTSWHTILSLKTQQQACCSDFGHPTALQLCLPRESKTETE